MRTAIHIYLSTFENESRILKETGSVVQFGIVNKVIVLARGREGLDEFEQIDEQRTVLRIRSSFLRNKTPFKGLGRLTQAVRLVDGALKFIEIIKIEKPSFVNLHQVLLLPLVPLIKHVSPDSILIYDAHELETETNGLIGLKKRLLKFFERRWIRYFAFTFVVSPSIEDWYKKAYGIKKIATVMNCPTKVLVEKKDLFRKDFGISQESRIFLYQGALFKGRGIEIILEAFSRIHNPRFTVVLMGYGELANLIQEYSNGYSNIFFKEAVPPPVVLDYTASADFGISLIENVCLSYYYCLPNKLFEYLMAEIPCIVSDMKEMSQYVQDFQTGVVCKEMNCSSLIESVYATEDFDLEGFKRKIGQVKEKFSWQEQEKTMIKSYNAIINEQ